ncbi:TonB-dependent receptor [uncultured Algoriphagus sp.]|uniref:SusC/RagA family TonB-linked outer membrane protein n=1 Tax=uncultured Algoriphagus sp. TaxID=417365 RepID=UPI002589E899|nr:TonB-dependent receptor [uncultured Algoriphagus sp.]
MEGKKVYSLMLTFLMLLSFSFSGIAQQRTVTGTVTDDVGQAVPGTTVLVKGTTNGTISDADGKYSIQVPSEDAILVFSFIGYQTVEEKVNGRSIIDVLLPTDEEQLEEVIVVGYGTQLQTKMTGSVQNVDAAELQDIPAAQLSQKLQGRLAGVQINQTTGAPGQGMQVRIRGQVSLSAGSEPLYVVDGQPITGDINAINPNEIESISVLKDAASTSLYGSRAANGVVIITTKRGSAQGTSVDLNINTGFQQVPYNLEQELLNATEWAQMRKEAFEDQGLAVPEVFQNPQQYGEGTDWFREITRTAPINDISVTFSSNQDKFRATAIAGYFNQKGVIENTGFERFSLRVNTDYTFNDRISAGFNVAPTFTRDNLVPTTGAFFAGNVVNNAMLTPPVLSPNQDLDGDGQRDLMLDVNPSFTGWPWPNYYNNILSRVNETQNTRILSNAYLSLDIVEGLNFRTSINIDMGSTYGQDFRPSTVAANPWQTVPRNSEMNIVRSNFTSWLNENILTYTKSFGDHNLEALAGYTAQHYRFEGLTASAQGHADDRITTLQSATVPGVPSNTIQEWGLLSYLGRVTYDYKGKYLLTAAIRRDGSSRFGADNRWGNFPSISAGWVISDENFMGTNGPLSFAKLRASWGITGNNNIGNYTQFGNVDIGQSTVFGSAIFPGAAATTIANRQLGWELSNQIDVGVDLAFFNDKLSFSYDYYNKISSDLLWSLAVPPASGFDSFTGNIGEIQFWGHEFLLNTRHRVGQLDIQFGGNIAFNRNEVLALDETVPFILNNNTLTIVGSPVGQFYGLVHDGVYVDQEDFDRNPKANISQVGGPKYVDVNGDGVTTYDGASGAPGSDDQTIIGNPIPDFIYGMNANLRFKNFDFTIVGSGSHGNDIFRRSLQGLVNHGDGLMNVLGELKDRWRSPENPGSGKWGKNYGSTPPQDRDWVSTNFVYDGSFFTIKTLTLGYTLPANTIKGIRSLRVYSNVQNAFVFTKYPGSNPEVGGTTTFNLGQDFATFPVPRTITFGLNVGF